MVQQMFAKPHFLMAIRQRGLLTLAEVQPLPAISEEEWEVQKIVLCASIKGTLIRKDYRKMARVGSTIALAGLSAFTIILMILRPGTSWVVNLVLVVPLFLLTAVCAYSRCKNFWILDIQYTCAENHIANLARKDSHDLSLSKPFFCTKIVVPFAYGMGGHIDEYFYMFSSVSPCDPERTTGGMAAIEYIWKRNGLLIPCTDEVDLWLTEAIGVKEIPMYPKVQYFQR